MNKTPNPIARLLFLDDPRTDRRIKNFLSLFIKLGYDVEFIFATPGKAGPDSKIDFIFNGIKAKQLILQHTHGARMFLQFDKILSVELQKSEDCDLLFAGDLYSLKTAVYIKNLGKAKQVFYDARELYTELPKVARSPLKKWFWKRWERIGLRSCDLVIVTAPDDAPAIRDVHNFLPPSIVVRNFPEQQDLKHDNYLRQHFSIPPDKKIIIYIGGLQRERGLEKMVEAMSLLKDDAVFVMIGDDELDKKLHIRITELDLEKSVFFHSSIDSEKVIEILSSADVGISLIEQHSKSYELALPSKIFEYMLAGLPVVSSPLKQVNDLLSNTEGVIFADPDNSRDLPGKLREALLDSEDNELRKRIHVNAWNNYTFETDAEIFKEFLNRNTKVS